MATALATGGRSSISKFIPSALLIGAAPLAHAHGFGQRFDLPLPLWLWLAGAGATVVVTFALMAIFVRERRLGLAYSRVSLKRLAPGRALIVLLQVAAVLLFILSLATGFFGNQDPYRNLLPTVVWVLWWVGLAFVCALAGNLWALVNPLDNLFRWVGAPSRNLAYPPWLGAWPGVVLFLCFAWAELVWTERDVPARLACAVLAYTVITWIGMFLYGRQTWLGNGEAFSIAFGVLGRFAPIDRSLYLRPPGAGLLSHEPVSTSFAVFVLLMLASVTHDGFLETPLFQQITTAVHASPAMSSALFELSELGLDESQLIDTVLLLFFPFLFVALFFVTSALMARRSPVRAGEAARGFVLTLVPIAVAYHLSHYFSLLLTAGQFIIPLASDPFGFGWDLFGTAGYKVDLGVVSPYAFWYGAVTLIVLGHVVAVVLAHAAALRMFGGRRAALASQVPMMALMVGYTTLSLWILA